jgi:hypothetical protein
MESDELERIRQRNVLLVIENDHLKGQLDRMKELVRSLHRERDEAKAIAAQYLDAHRDVVVSELERGPGDDDGDPGDEHKDLGEEYDGVMVIDGANSALMGVGQRCGQPTIAIYSYDALVAHYMADGMSEGEAIEWIEVNIIGAWMGEGTPIVLVESDE